MALTPGTRLGAYEVTTQIGAGGMGEVYRARDSKLNREVAIKKLPDAFVSDPERLGRFEREAQLLASLNHPNIAHVYGLERQDAATFIVMELVDGEELAARIARGPIPPDEALPILREIVDALESAHEKGIVHRDLKPANIALTKDGQVKILDFGLAKLEPAGSASASGPVELTHSPTLTFAGTHMGVILGTAAYMSPEQAKGRPADKRSDVWAFGCVAFEMLSQQRAFAGEDVSDTLAAILRGEPDWTALPGTVPAHLRGILRRCLDKDRRSRIPDMSVVRFLMADASAAESAAAKGDVSTGNRWRAAPWALAGALGVAFLVALWLPWQRTSLPPRPVTRFTFAPAGGLFSAATASGPVALSPDGTRIAFVAQTDSGARMIQVRDLDQLDVRPLRETEGMGGASAAGYPFFSPDGKWIGFIVGGTLKKVPAIGGPVTTICEFRSGWRGAAWLPDDTIVVALEGRELNGLFRVPAAGGTLAPIARVEKSELAYRWPDALPGGKAVIFVDQGGGDASLASIVLLHLDTNERRTLITGGSYPRYVSSGHIVFARAGTLLAVPFDLEALRISGAPTPVVQSVTMATATGQTQFAVSQSGTLVYANMREEGGPNLVWVDRHGAVQPIVVPPQNFEHPRLSPDGLRLVVDIRAASTTDVWLYTFARGTLSRLTFGHSESEAPVWTPDGTRVTYAATLPGQPPRAIAWKLADNSGDEEVLARGDVHLHPLQWGPRGDVLLLNESASSSSDTYGLFIGEQRTLRPIARTPFKETSAAFSPDGRWMAYASDETGRFEVYVQAFPGPGGKSQISADGGVEPLWARSGRELFFRDSDKMMAVAMDAGRGTASGTPTVLFQGRFVASTSVDRWYDVSPDGQRFLMLRTADSGRSTATLTVVQEWGSELKRMSVSKP